MAWIESHQELARHPKTKRLARLLDVSIVTAIGHLHLLWWWAMDFAQSGDLSRYDYGDIADGAMWDGDAKAFVDALIGSGFVDVEPLRLHDWSEYAGRLIERRRQDAARKRAERQKMSNGHPQDIQRTAHVTVPNLTGQNQTGPEQDSRPGAAEPPPSRLRAKQKPRGQASEDAAGHQAMFAAVVRVFGRDPTHLNNAERTLYGKVASELSQSKLRPEDVPRLKAAIKAKLPHITITPSTLSKHVYLLDEPAETANAPNGKSEPRSRVVIDRVFAKLGVTEDAAERGEGVVPTPD